MNRGFCQPDVSATNFDVCRITASKCHDTSHERWGHPPHVGWDHASWVRRYTDRANQGPLSTATVCPPIRPCATGSRTI